jgi:hypothetical protein
VIDVSGLNGQLSIGPNWTWTLALPADHGWRDHGVRVHAGAARHARRYGAALAAQIHATATYDATYNTGNDRLTITRIGNWTAAATFTITENRPNRVVSGPPQAATEITLAGNGREGEQWQVSLPSGGPALHTVALDTTDTAAIIRN